MERPDLDRVRSIITSEKAADSVCEAQSDEIFADAKRRIQELRVARDKARKFTKEQVRALQLYEGVWASDGGVVVGARHVTELWYVVL
jgi:hypothetical protein